MPIDIASGLDIPKIDMHSHVFHMDDPDREAQSADHLVAAGDLYGIAEFWTCGIIPYRMGSIDEVRAVNDTILGVMKRHPNRIRGLCFAIPSHWTDALDEIDRCLDEGMVGLKLYHQYQLSDPVQYPVVEKAIERQVPILMHAGKLTPEHHAEQPLVSYGEHFTELSKRYPEAMLIHAHVGGGGDWEWTIRAMRGCSENVFADVSGSNLDDQQVEFAVHEMGADRVLFGSDGTMAGSTGKVLDATLTDAERFAIFYGNAARILKRQRKSPLDSGVTTGSEEVAV
jgi:uncharacterized protein